MPNPGPLYSQDRNQEFIVQEAGWVAGSVAAGVKYCTGGWVGRRVCCGGCEILYRRLGCDPRTVQ